jgi:uncharacterized phage-associated protein
MAQYAHAQLKKISSLEDPWWNTIFQIKAH